MEFSKSEIMSMAILDYTARKSFFSCNAIWRAFTENISCVALDLDPYDWVRALIEEYRVFTWGASLGGTKPYWWDVEGDFGELDYFPERLQALTNFRDHLRRIDE